MAIPLLFGTVVLGSNIDSWGRLQNICNTPHLAKWVDTMHVVTTRPIKTLSKKDMEGYKQRLAACPKPLPRGGPLSRLLYDPKHILKRYQRWYVSEQELIAHADRGTMPGLQVDLLDKLRCVKTLGQETKTVQRQWYDLRYRGEKTSWRHQPRGSRMEAETCLVDSVDASHDHAANAQAGSGSVPFRMLL